MTGEVRTGGCRLPVELVLPATGQPPAGWVILVRQSGVVEVGRRPETAALLHSLQRAGLATLSVDLLTAAESTSPAVGFNTPLLGVRLVAVARWLAAHPQGRGRPVGLIAAGYAAAAALWAAAELRGQVSGVVSLGGRVDLAARRFGEITAPVLLVVNRRDRLVLSANRAAQRQLTPASRLVVAPSFRYLRYWLTEPAALDRLLAREWLALTVLGQPLPPEQPRLTEWLARLDLPGKAAAAATVLALLATLAGPPQPAEAAGSVSISSGVLTFSDTNGEVNNLTLQYYEINFGFPFEDGYYLSDSSQTVTAGAGCTQVDANTVQCVGYSLVAGTDSISSVVINANNLNDTITVEDFGDPTTVSAGSGDDTLNVQAAGAALTLNTNAGNDTVNLGSAAPSVFGTLVPLQGVVTVNGGDADVLNLGDGASPMGVVAEVSLGSSGRTLDAGAYEIDLGSSAFGGGVTYYLGNGPDTARVYSTLSGEALRLYANGSSDTVNLGMGDVRNLDGSVFVATTSGDVNLLINNANDPTSYGAVSFSPTGISGLAGATITYEEVQIKAATLQGGTGADTVTLTGHWDNPTAGGEAPRYVNGGFGNDTFKVGTDFDLNGGLLDGSFDSDTISYELWNSGVTVNLAFPFAPNVSLMAGIDNVTGSTGNDLLLGNSISNALNGIGGTDTVGSSGDSHHWVYDNRIERVGFENDIDTLSNIEAVSISGGSGGQILDAYNQSSYRVTLFGNGGNDWLVGGSLDDCVNGGSGNDSVMGSWGNDTLAGGADTDWLREINNFAELHLYNTSLTGSTGTDTLTDSFEEVSIEGGSGNNLVNLSQWSLARTFVWGHGGDDTVRLGSGNHNDWIDGGTHSAGDRVEQIDVRNAVMFVNGQLTTIDSSNNTNGTDQLFSIEGIVLTGTASADYLDAIFFPYGPVSLYGAGGDDFVFGSAFNDFLDGGSGNDQVAGQGGDDTVSGGEGSDTVNGGPHNVADTMILDMGNLDVTLSGTSINDSGSDDDEVTNVERLIVNGGDGGQKFDAGEFGGEVSMFGNGGNDTLIAGTGGGSLDGGAGTADRLEAQDDGGLSLSNSLLVKGGTNFAVAGFELASLTGGTSGDVISTASFTGSATLVGEAGNDTLTGGPSHDSLQGVDGHDSLVGNAGNDTIDGGDGGDTASGGNDNDSLVGGNDDDQLFGNAGANTLKGDAGNDSLVGEGGNDSLAGGEGTDTLTAGLGTNTVDGGGGTLDRLVENLVAQTGPFSLTLTSSSYNLSLGATASALLTDIELAHLTGSGQSDTLDASGFSGQVTLLGGGGNDELSGSEGSDSIGGGAGTDIASFKIGNNNVTLTGGALEGQGNDTLDSIEGYRVVGGAGSQTIDATAFQPASGTLGVTVDGGGGGDRLLGSPYRDSLFGNAGNDTIFGNGEADTIDGGDGTADVVGAEGAGPYTLTDTSLITNGVTDVLSRTEAAVITGSIGADVINAWGFSGRVTLVGDAGSDVLQVGTGGGSLLGDAGVDSLRVLGDADYTLSNTELELPSLGQTYALASTEAVSITAGALANTLDASAYTGNVTLMGAGGGDVLKGGQGNDSVLGGDGDDLVGGGPGADTLDGGPDAVGDTWVETGAVTVTLVSLGLPGVPIDTVTGLEKAVLTGDGSPNIFNLIGFTGTATLKGGDGNDFLTGGSQPDDVQGEGGDDTLTGSAAFDILDGGSGNDRLVAFGDATFDLSDDRLEGQGTSTDTLSSIEEAVLTGFGGSSQFDASSFGGPVSLIGGDGPDTLIGGLVNDSIVGDGGDDHMEGRDGNDTLTGLLGNDSMDGGPGTDLLNGFLGNDSLAGGDGNDTLIGAEGSDSVVGGDGNDLLSHAFDVLTTTVGITMDDTLRGGPGLDTLEGGVGYDIVEEIGNTSYTLTNSSLVNALGNDTLSAFEAARLTGGVDGNLFNTLVFTGPVTLDGQDGSDTFLAGGQNDSLIGGAGSGDQLHASNNAHFTLSDTLLTGLGNDSLSLVEQAIITGGVDANHLNAGAFTLGPITLTGGQGNDTLVGGAGSDSLDAGEGDDTLTGNAGDNTLLGGAGTNMVVETSDVHYTLANSLLVGTTTVPGASLTDVLSNTTLAQLTGGASPNLINASGFTGTVTLDGGAGADTLLGGSGADLLKGGADDDQVSATADVNFTLTNTLLTGLGADTLESIERASLTAGASANLIDAGAFSAGPVTLTGLAGNDTLIGGQQNDVLDAGPDDDLLTGGDGNDSFLGGAGNDLVDDSVSGGGSFVLTPVTLTGRGIDTLSGIEGVKLTGGSAANNLNAQAANVPVTLAGGPGNDTLVGSAQNDSLSGGADDDVLTGGAGRDTLDGGTGSGDLLLETINAHSLLLNNSALTADFIGVPDGLVTDLLVTNGSTPTFERANLSGGALDNLIDTTGFNGTVTLNGLAGHDTLRGGPQADSLDGGQGNDSLEGFNGNDTLRGGPGNDTLKGGEGASNLLEGEDGADSLLGGLGSDTLHGGGGNDTLTGLAGSDSLHGQGDTDLLVELVAGHVVVTDTLMTGLGTDTLASLELLQLTGSINNDTIDGSAYTVGAFTLAGQGGADVLRGGALADSLLGGEGNDSLTGNGGNDTLDGDGGTDWAVETANGLMVLTDAGLVSGLGTDTHLEIEHASLNGGTGSDTLDASAYTLGAVILRGGDGADSLIGTGLADSLFGESGADFLDGRLGNDSLSGGGEADTAVAVGDASFIVTADSLVGAGSDSLAPDIESVSLTGGASDNAFNLFAWPGLATVTGGGGIDLLQVGGSLADDNFLIEAGRVINGAVTIDHAQVEWLEVNAGDGNDTLTIDDSLAVAAGADGAAITASGLTHITLAGGLGDDFFRMEPQSSLLVHVDGGDHAAGDTLEYDASDISLDQQPGLLLPQGGQPTSHTGIEIIDLLRNWVINNLYIPFFGGGGE